MRLESTAPNIASIAFQIQAKDKANNFNLIRLLMAFLVILAHSPQMIDGNANREPLRYIFGTLTFGQFAVDIFFLLSGYLILQSWEARPEILPFLKKRILRIYPAFIIAAFFSVFVFGALATPFPAEYLSQISIFQFSTDLLTLKMPKSPPTFVGSFYPTVNGSMWTIRYEFFCYLSIVLLGLLKVFDRKKLLIVVLIIFTCCSTAKNLGYLQLLGIPSDETTFPMFRFSSFFVAGNLFCLYRKNIRLEKRYASVAGLGLVLGLNFQVFAEISVVVFGSYLMFFLAFKNTNATAWINKLPDASYGFYLYGWPVAKLLIWKFPSINLYVLVTFTTVLAYFLGILSWYLVEQPALKLKNVKSKVPVATV